MRKYTEYDVLGFDEPTGNIRILWSVKDHPAWAIIKLHRVPLLAETENWSKDKLLDHFRAEIPHAADVPEWLKEEVYLREVIVKDKTEEKEFAKAREGSLAGGAQRKPGVGTGSVR